MHAATDIWCAIDVDGLLGHCFGISIRVPVRGPSAPEMAYQCHSSVPFGQTRKYFNHSRKLYQTWQKASTYLVMGDRKTTHDVAVWPRGTRAREHYTKCGLCSINARKGQRPPLVAHQSLSDHLLRRAIVGEDILRLGSLLVSFPVRKRPHEEDHYD